MDHCQFVLHCCKDLTPTRADRIVWVGSFLAIFDYMATWALVLPLEKWLKLSRTGTLKCL